MCSQADDPSMHDRIAAVNTPGAHYIDGDGEEWVVGENGTDRPASDLCRVCGAVDLFDDEADDLCVACAIAARQEMTDLQEWQRDMGAR